MLDKTGTVTTGRMSVLWAVAAAGEGADEVVAVAGALESASGHPVARAVAKYAAQNRTPTVPVADFRSVDGLGVRGTVGGRAALVGRPRLLAEHGVTVPGDLAAVLADAARRGATGVVVAWSGRARGVLVVADTVRPTSAAAVADLRRLGLDPLLVTSGNPGAARTAAAEIGVERVVADAPSADKVEMVRRLQAEGRVVAVIGDGVNDAAALAQADLGIAMGSGTDAAIHACDLTLVRADLGAAVDAIRLSRRTLAVIKGNLFWAFAYNAAAIPLAALGLLDPMLAGDAIAASSVFLVTNSLRLRRFAALPTADGTR